MTLSHENNVKLNEMLKRSGKMNVRNVLVMGDFNFGKMKLLMVKMTQKRSSFLKQYRTYIFFSTCSIQHVLEVGMHHQNWIWCLQMMRP